MSDTESLFDRDGGVLSSIAGSEIPYDAGLNIGALVAPVTCRDPCVVWL